MSEACLGDSAQGCDSTHTAGLWWPLGCSDPPPSDGNSQMRHQPCPTQKISLLSQIRAVLPFSLVGKFGAVIPLQGSSPSSLELAPGFVK